VPPRRPTPSQTRSQPRAKPALAHDDAPDADGRIRLQKFLAQAGIAARRGGEALIAQGRVSINSELVRTLPAFVDPAIDRVEVDGRLVVKPAGRYVYIMLHKPTRVLSSAADEPGMDRRTVVDLVQHPLAKRLFPVGRLEYDATGLVLLTNDGELAHRLTHPRFGVAQVYHAAVKGTIPDDQIPALVAKVRRQAKLFAKRARMEKRTLKQERGQRGPLPGRRKPPPSPAPELRIEKREPDKTTLAIRLHDARSVPLQDVLLACGLNVKRVTRVGLGPLELKGVGLGFWRELERDEVKLLRREVGVSSGEGANRAGASSRVRGKKSKMTKEPENGPEF
jgi:23S rRNA pseudouridine2605 synthase